MHKSMHACKPVWTYLYRDFIINLAWGGLSRGYRMRARNAFLCCTPLGRRRLTGFFLKARVLWARLRVWERIIMWPWWAMYSNNKQIEKQATNWEEEKEFLFQDEVCDWKKRNATQYHTEDREQISLRTLPRGVLPGSCPGLLASDSVLYALHPCPPLRIVWTSTFLSWYINL